MPSSKKQASTKRETPEAQSKRFIEKARELECDDDPEGFEHTFKRVVPSVTPVRAEKKPQKK